MWAQAMASREPLSVWGLSGQRYEQEAAERIDVGPAVQGLGLDLLGREISGRSHRTALTRLGALLLERAGQPEVGQVDVFALV